MQAVQRRHRLLRPTGAIRLRVRPRATRLLRRSRIAARLLHRQIAEASRHTTDPTTSQTNRRRARRATPAWPTRTHLVRRRVTRIRLRLPIARRLRIRARVPAREVRGATLRPRLTRRTVVRTAHRVPQDAIAAGTVLPNRIAHVQRRLLHRTTRRLRIQVGTPGMHPVAAIATPPRPAGGAEDTTADRLVTPLDRAAIQPPFFICTEV